MRFFASLRMTNPSVSSFSTVPKVCGYKKPNYDTVSKGRGIV
jgi:hypothetical protein